MRLSELLACSVYDDKNTLVGTVTDVRLAQIGPVEGPMAELIVESLLVSPRATGSLFGYERRSEQGPWLVPVVIQRLHRRAFLVPWADVGYWDRDNQRVSLASRHRRQAPAGPGR